MLLKDFCVKNGFEGEYNILKDKTNEHLKQFRMKKSKFKEIEVEYDSACGYSDYLNDRICLGESFLIKNLKERNTNEILSTIIHEIAHYETFRKSKYLKKLYLNLETEDYDCCLDDVPKYSFKHTRNFLLKNVESYSYDYEFGVFETIVDLNELTKKQFDQLSLCILKDFLNDQELCYVDPFFCGMDETISFGFESIIHGIENEKEYFNKYLFENREMFLYYSLFNEYDKSYLLKDMCLNNQIIEEIFDTYNHSRVVKNAEKMILLESINELIGRNSLKKLEKL